MDPAILFPLLVACHVWGARANHAAGPTFMSAVFEYSAAEDAIRAAITDDDTVTPETAAAAEEKVWESTCTVSTLEAAASASLTALNELPSTTNNRFRKAAKKHAAIVAAVDAAKIQLGVYQDTYKTLLQSVPTFFKWRKNEHLVSLTKKGLTYVGVPPLGEEVFPTCTLPWSEFPSHDHLRIRWVSYPHKGDYDADGSPVVLHDDEVEATLRNRRDGHKDALVFTVESPNPYGVGFRTCLKIVSYYTLSPTNCAVMDIEQSYRWLHKAILDRICGSV